MSEDAWRVVAFSDEHGKVMWPPEAEPGDASMTVAWDAAGIFRIEEDPAGR